MIIEAPAANRDVPLDTNVLLLILLVARIASPFMGFKLFPVMNTSWNTSLPAPFRPHRGHPRRNYVPNGSALEEGIKFSELCFELSDEWEYQHNAVVQAERKL
jgi:hypothetical protein